MPKKEEVVDVFEEVVKADEKEVAVPSKKPTLNELRKSARATFEHAMKEKAKEEK